MGLLLEMIGPRVAFAPAYIMAAMRGERKNKVCILFGIVFIVHRRGFFSGGRGARHHFATEAAKLAALHGPENLVI
jgi:hypothetical protein